jgi:hypothetical protein
VRRQYRCRPLASEFLIEFADCIGIAQTDDLRQVVTVSSMLPASAWRGPAAFPVLCRIHKILAQHHALKTLTKFYDQTRQRNPTSAHMR